MWKSLATKELRETRLIALAALALYAYFLSGAIGWRVLPLFGSSSSGGIPFVTGGFSAPFIWVSVGLAVALALRQSLWESMQGVFVFLLHRPVSRRRIFAVKLAVGLGLYLLCASLPVLLYAWWAAIPGNHASPFEWSMTWPTWKVWLTMTAVYLATFLCGIRPAHWLWSRLWPLIATAVLVLLIQFLPWWPILGIAAILVLDAALVAGILDVAEKRDFS